MKATKTCKDCGIEQPLDAFPRCGGVRGDGTSRPAARCFPCQRVWKRSYREGERRQAQRSGEIPSAPFVKWLTEVVVRIGDTKVVARSLDIDERFLYRWTKRPSPFIMETTVDRMFCAAGEPYLLREMYPGLYGEELAA